MQIWTFLDQARQLAAKAYNVDLIYDDPTTLIASLTDDRDTLEDQFHQPTTDRAYWTIRRALERLTYEPARYAQDGNHGPDTDPPALPNPTYPLFLHQAGELATSNDNPDNLYAHWEAHRLNLDTWTATLANELAKPPANRDRETILATLTNVSAYTALFACRAHLTIHDRDPHSEANYAIIAYLWGEWDVLENHCDPGYVPDIPTEPGQFPGETLCKQCRPIYYGAPRSTSQQADAAPFIPITPYHPTATTETTAGIVTAANHSHWRCLAATVLFANLHRIPIAIADHGLTDAQRSNLKRFAVHWIRHQEPHIPSDMPPHHAIAPPRAWQKPWVCLASPWERSLWIDADAVPVHSIRQALENHSPTLQIATNTTWNQSSAYLYARLLTTIDPTAETLTDEHPETAVNTGVFAWTKGNQLIDQWRAHAANILAQPHLHGLAGVRDQSAMFLALRFHRLNGGQLVEYLAPEWNTPADNLPAPAANQRRPTPANPTHFLAVAIARHPTAKIVHWLGFPKPNQLPFTEH